MSESEEESKKRSGLELDDVRSLTRVYRVIEFQYNLLDLTRLFNQISLYLLITFLFMNY